MKRGFQYGKTTKYHTNDGTSDVYDHNIKTIDEPKKKGAKSFLQKAKEYFNDSDKYSFEYDFPHGMDDAYREPEKVYYDNEHKVIYVAGTSQFRDLFTDVAFSATGDEVLRLDPRYDQIDMMLIEHPETRAIAGHSLGARIIDRYMSDHPHKRIGIMYDSLPEVRYNIDDPREIYDHHSVLDPISMADLGASSTTFTKPHDYHDI